MHDRCKYTHRDLWVLVDGDTARIGITHHSALLGSAVQYVELGEKTGQAKIGEGMCIVESADMVEELVYPLDGRVTAVNEVLLSEPRILSDDCYGRGWLVEMKVSSSNDRLLSPEAYAVWRQRVEASLKRFDAPFGPNDLIGLVINGLELKSILGRGAEGVVYSGIDWDTGEEDKVLKVANGSFKR